MIGHSRSLFVGVLAALFIAAAARSSQAQVLTAPAPGGKVDETVHIHADLTNGEQNTFDIPDNRDFILTDVIATCRTINACAFQMFGGVQNASDQLVMFLVAPTSTVSHSFTTGIRVPGGGGAQLFIQNFNQPGPNALLYITITGYLVKK